MTSITPQTDTKITFLRENGGTSDKTRAKCPFFNDFCVPLNAWDKPGTRVGHGTSGTKKEAAETASVLTSPKRLTR